RTGRRRRQTAGQSRLYGRGNEVPEIPDGAKCNRTSDTRQGIAVRSFKVRSRFLCSSIIALMAVLALSPVLIAQSRSTKAFDAHDLTGYWEMTNIGRPSGALNTASNNRPPMTDWAKGMFGKTRTGYKDLTSGV